jgi:hypothetical protein
VADRRSRLDGILASVSALDAVPVAARHAFADALGPVARDVLAAQQQAVARRTGYLASGLETRLEIERLRARVGLLSFKAGRNSRFYGRFIQYGRKSDVVDRLRKKLRPASTLKEKRRASRQIGQPKRLQVKFLAGRPFVVRNPAGVNVEERLAQALEQAMLRHGLAG